MDPRELKFAMWGAWAAGHDNHVPTEWLPNSLVAKRMVRGSLEGYIFQNPTHVIVAFQGTEMEWGDIWTDLMFRKQKLPGVPGKWHRGFLEGAGQFFIEIHDWLKHNRGDRKVIFTGFSLGAALAQTLSVLFSFLRSEPHTVYAFGGPRVANRRAGRWLADRTEHYRIHTYDDPVVHAPPFFFNYKHFGHLGVLDQHGKLHEGPTAWWHAGLFPKGKRHGHDLARYLLLVRKLV